MESKIGRDIIVVGGGNVAVDVAITAKRLGAANVVMACLEPEHQMPASEEELNRARDEGITILPSWGPKEILRDHGEIVGLVLKQCTAVFDEQGHFAPSQGRDSWFAAASVIVIISRRHHRARRRICVFYRNNLRTGSFSPLSVIVITRRASILPRSKGGALASAEPPGSAADLYTHLRWGYKYASLAGFLVYRQKIEVRRWMSS